MRIPLSMIVMCSLAAGLSSQEAYWLAVSGGVKKVDTAGVVHVSTTPGSSRDVKVAPDGKLWMVASGITVLNADGSPFTTISPSAGISPYSIAFDIQGHAWVSGGSGVEEFDAAGTSLGTITLPASAPLGISVDAMGNKWIVHRVGPPGSISRIDGITRAVTNYPMPVGSLILPTNCYADARGPLQPSHIWVVGDNRGAGELLEFDDQGNNLNRYVINAAGRFQWMSADVDSTGSVVHIWVGDWSNGDLHRVDAATGGFVTFPQGTGIRGVTFDGFGRLWLSFPTGGLLRRIDPSSMTNEVDSAVGAASQLSTRWQYATTVDPFGDLDGDTFSNFAEITAGSSPFDPLSTPQRSLQVAGPTGIGTTTVISVLDASGIQTLVLFSIDTVSPGLPIPGFGGDLQLNTANILPVSLSFTGTSTVSLGIPNNAALVGGTLYVQGLNIFLSSFTNAAGMLFY